MTVFVDDERRLSASLGPTVKGDCAEDGLIFFPESLFTVLCLSPGEFFRELKNSQRAGVITALVAASNAQSRGGGAQRH